MVADLVEPGHFERDERIGCPCALEAIDDDIVVHIQSSLRTKRAHFRRI